jgi:hypothetical protein
MDTRCRKHPQTDATSECHRCGTKVCFLCAVDFRDVTYCSMGCAEKDGAVADHEGRKALFPPPAPSLAEGAASTCVNHPNTPATAACQKCGSGACMLCTIQNAEGTFCSQECTEKGTQIRHRSTVVTRAMASLVGSLGKKPRCAAHPGVDATVVCDSCKRQACDDCKVKAPWGVFCGLECFAWFREHQSRQALGARRVRRGGRRWVVAAAALAVVGGGAFAGWKLGMAPRPGPVKDSGSGSVAEASPKAGAVEAPPAVEPPGKDPVRPEPPRESSSAVPKLDPPEPVPPVSESPRLSALPRPAVHLDLARDPWRGESAGAWYRVRERTAEEERFRDVGLDARENGQQILVQQLMTAAGKDFEVRYPLAVDELRVVGGVRLALEGGEYEFDLVESKFGLGRMWVVKTGRFAGATLAEDWKGRKVAPKRFGTETLVVRGRKFPCLVVTSELGGVADGHKAWIAPHYPLGPVKLEVEGLRMELVDWGLEWGRRPEFPEPARPGAPLGSEDPAPPTPAPEKLSAAAAAQKAKVERALAEAAQLIREAMPLYADVARRSSSPPEDGAARDALMEKAVDARSRLSLARSLYEGVRAQAPSPEVLDRRISQLSESIDGLDAVVDRLKRR